MEWIFYNHLEKADIKGKVKQIKQTSYDVVKRNGKYVAGKIDNLHYVHIYNFYENGFKKEHFFYKKDGSYEHTLNDEEGHQLYYKHYDKNGVVSNETIFEYDDDKKLLAQCSYNAKGLLTDKIARVYNEKGLLIESTIDNAIKGRTHLTLIKYNDQDKEVEKKIFLENNKLHCWERYEFDENGNQTITQKLNENEELIDTRINFYDDDNKYLGYREKGETIMHDFDNESDLDECIYDEFGNWIEKLCYFYETPEDYNYREFTYYNHPSENTILDNKNIITNMAQHKTPVENTTISINFTEEQLKWLAEGYENEEEIKPHRFYTLMNKHLPSIKKLSAYQVELICLKQDLEQHLNAKEIHMHITQHGGHDRYCHSYTLYFPQNGYVLEATNISHQGAYLFKFTDINTSEDRLHNYVNFGEINLYYPSPVWGKIDEDFEKELLEYFSNNRVEKKPEKPEIKMVANLGGTFHLKAYPIHDNFEINDLDLNYGNGFEKFHNELMHRFETQNQGLFLFHGEPGTGKTYYIRHLLKNMQQIKKVVIYMPPNMVDYLVDPTFMSFISTQVNLFSAKGFHCILLVEDAEPLLVARDADTRIQGITNLLNMTDGILNDMLKLQIICTFNVNLKQLDKALLRPGRLSARKEFKALQPFEANILAHQLGIKHVFESPASLAEIYAQLNHKDTLMHDE